MTDRKDLTVTALVSLLIVIAVLAAVLIGQYLIAASTQFDSGWIDFTDEGGQNVTVVHNLNSKDLQVDIIGKTSINGNVHQKYLGLTGVTQGWAQTYGSPESDEVATSVVYTREGGYAFAGYTLAFQHTPLEDFWLVKTDANGNAEWNRTYTQELGGRPSSLIQTDDGGYALAGYVFHSGLGSADFWLIKTDADGNAEWNRTYGGLGDDRANSLIQTKDGGYVLAGGVNLGSLSGSNLSLVKTDANGTQLWSKSYEGVGIAPTVVQATDGGYALADGSLLIKTDVNGTLQWNQTYAWGVESRFRSLIQTEDKGYAIAGYVESSWDIYPDFWLVKTDSDGSTQWNRTYGDGGSEISDSLIQTVEGGYALAGWRLRLGYDWSTSNAWLVKTDADGNLQWNRTYGRTGNPVANSLLQLTDGSYILAGATASFGIGDSDALLIKTIVEYGLTWTAYDSNSITLYRGATDPYWNFVRVRIKKSG